MYEKILNALKTKFKGVPSKVLELRAKNISKTVTEEDGVQTAVDGITLENLFEAHGDSRATQATDTANSKGDKKLADWRKKHNLDEDGKPIESGGGDDDDDEDQDEDEKTPKWAKKVFKKVDDLSIELAGYKQKEVATERATTIVGKLKTAGIPEKLQKRFSIADDADNDAVDTAITEYKQELNDLGIAGMKEPGGGGGNDTDSQSKAIAESRNSNSESNSQIKGKDI